MGPATFSKTGMSVIASASPVQPTLTESDGSDLSVSSSSSNSETMSSESYALSESGQEQQPSAIQSQKKNRDRDSDSEQDSDSESIRKKEKKERARREKKKARLLKKQRDEKKMNVSSRSKTNQASSPVTAEKSVQSKGHRGKKVRVNALAGELPKDGVMSESQKENVLLVKQLAPFSDSVAWDETEYVVRVNKTLKELQALSDADGNVTISLGDGSVTVERTTPAIHDRLTSKIAAHSASAIHANPSKFSSKSQVVHEAKIISAHNSFPVSLTLALSNIVGSANSVVYPINSANELHALAFSVQQGEKLSNHRVLRNNFKDKQGFAFSAAFPSFTADNLRQGVISAHPLNGVSRVLVPHSEERYHPVIILAQTDISKTMTEEQRAKYGDMIPPEILAKSQDNPGYYIMSEEHFNKYHDRCVVGLTSRTPLSDVSNPHGKIFLSIRDLVKSNSAQSNAAVSSKKSIDGDIPTISCKNLWTENQELETHRTNATSKESAKDTRYNFFARVLVTSKDAAALAVHS